MVWYGMVYVDEDIHIHIIILLDFGYPENYFSLLQPVFSSKIGYFPQKLQ